MSVINLLGNLFCANYPTFYLVESWATREVTKDYGIKFIGTVGKLPDDYEQDLYEKIKRVGGRLGSELALALGFLLGALPLVVIAGLTHFHKGESTYAQRVWIMTWICFGSWLGPVFAVLRKFDHRLEMAIGVSIYGAPAIGGMVITRQMIQSYGVCHSF